MKQPTDQDHAVGLVIGSSSQRLRCSTFLYIYIDLLYVRSVYLYIGCSGGLKIILVVVAAVSKVILVTMLAAAQLEVEAVAGLEAAVMVVVKVFVC